MLNQPNLNLLWQRFLKQQQNYPLDNKDNKKAKFDKGIFYELSFAFNMGVIIHF